MIEIRVLCVQRDGGPVLPPDVPGTFRHQLLAPGSSRTGKKKIDIG
jgi:hypothetical protein